MYWVLACTAFLLFLGSSTAAATAATQTTANTIHRPAYWIILMIFPIICATNRRSA